MRTLPAAICVLCVASLPACTRHNVHVKADEPIVIRVEARIDIYNHAAEIEDMVSGKAPIELPAEEKGNSSFFLDPFASSACAAERGSLRMAIARRRERYDMIQELKRRGIAGENLQGYLTIRARATAAQKMLAQKENEDREIIYVETARERKAPLQEVQRGFADVLRRRADPGTWIETESGWVQK